MTYRSAVKVLTGTSPTVAEALDKTLGGGIILASLAVGPAALALMGVKNEVVKWGQNTLARIPANLDGSHLPDRLLNIRAAHSILVVTSLLEIANETFSWAKIGITDKELVAFIEQNSEVEQSARNLVESVLARPIPIPEPNTPFDETVDTVRIFADSYLNTLRSVLVRYAGAAKMPSIIEALEQAHFAEAVANRYRGTFYKLAGEVPEFALWCLLDQHGAVISQLGSLKEALTRASDPRLMKTGLQDLEILLSALDSRVRRESSEKHQQLRSVYELDLQRPAVDSVGQLPPGLTPPSRIDSYQNPNYQIVDYEKRSSQVANEKWWAEKAIRDDIGLFLASYLPSLRATTLPLVVLGQPGAGKSLLTQILAANLPPDSFTTVRVQLRKVAKNSDPAWQVEDALQDALKERISYAEFVASRKTIPVVLFDGFDELVQASRSSHSDYLENVAKFQEEEAARGRPTVAIVTSRVSVADRTRVPESALVLKLAPLDETQIRNWVVTWNLATSTGLETRGRRALDADLVLKHPELARQPILLLMLALYDADDNGLSELKKNLQSEALYEALLVNFVRREVTREHEQASDSEILRGVERDMFRLSVAAFGMFNRGGQLISEQDLQDDLVALDNTSNVLEGQPPTESHVPSRAQHVIGRFFFVHTSVATETPHASSLATMRDTAQTTFEFLHSTFGEYLIARLISQLLPRVKRRVEAVQPWDVASITYDDSLLFDLLSGASLVTRTQILSFIRQSESRQDETQVWDVADVCRLVLARLEPPSGLNTSTYNPASNSAFSRSAIYTSNIFLVYGMLHPIVDVKDLAPVPGDAKAWWRSRTLFWESQLPEADWIALANTFTLEANSDSLDLRFGTSPEQLNVPWVRGDRIMADLVAQHGTGHEPIRGYVVLDDTRGLYDSARARADFSADEMMRLMLDAVNILTDATGPGASQTLLSVTERATNTADTLLADSILGIELFIAAAYYDGLIQTDDRRYLDFIFSGISAIMDDSTAEHHLGFLRNFSSSVGLLSEEVAERVVQEALRWRDDNADFDFVTWLCIAASSAYAHFGSERLFEGAVLRATDVEFLLREMDRRPNDVLRFVLAVERTGVSIDEIDADGVVGDFASWLNRTPLRTIAESNPETLTAALRMVRQRATAAWFAQRYDLVDFALQHLEDSDTLRYFIACQVLAKSLVFELEDAVPLENIASWVNGREGFREGVAHALRGAVTRGPAEDQLFESAAAILMSSNL